MAGRQPGRCLRELALGGNERMIKAAKFLGLVALISSSKTAANLSDMNRLSLQPCRTQSSAI
jgi:hypothetical protein